MKFASGFPRFSLSSPRFAHASARSTGIHSSQVVLGVTSTGEGVTFMMLWTFAGQFGLLGDDYTFQKAVSTASYPSAARRCDFSCFVSQVFYTSFFPVFCSPPILWAARLPTASILHPHLQTHQKHNIHALQNSNISF